MSFSEEESQARLRSILNSLSESHGSSVSELTNFLNSVSNSALAEPDNEELKANAFEALSRLSQFIASSSLTEEIADALSFELPSVASRLAGVSDGCAKIVAELIDRFVSTCNPRDMLSILCEALAYSSDIDTVEVCSAYYVPILRGISKVFISIQRRHFEQVKSSIPVVLNVLKAVSLKPEDKNEDTEDLLGEALSIAISIKEVCTKVEGNVNEKLCALLGLYVLQIMVDIAALASFSKNCEASNSNSLVAQLSIFVPYCGLSYIGLITGFDVNRMTSFVVGESEDDFTSCLSHVNHGASLAVIWGYIHDAALQAAKEDLLSFEDELRKDQTKRWQAIGMLKHVLASPNLPQGLKKQAINIVLSITNGDIVKKYDDGEDSNCSDYVPSLFAALKALQSVLMFSSDAELRRNAFDAFKKILADIPSSQRFDILKALIISSDSPSMIALLLDIVRSELNMENRQRTGIEKEKSTDEEVKAHKPTPFWSFRVLELVEPIFRPPKGGPPTLPEQGDSVLSALNLYRFVLITESTGKTNYTEVLSKSNLQKAHKEWLLPLRTLVTGIMAENDSDYDQFAVDTVCAINPIELVLYRCIELVEEKLKQLG